MSTPVPCLRTVEADTLPHAERSAAVLSLFDSLPPGQSFVFSTRESSDWLLGLLRAERRGQFDWTPLPGDPRQIRVEVARRAADRGSLRRVSDALGWDHDRLARLEVCAFVARAAGDGARARKCYEEFASGLGRHIAVEEQILFPLYERRSEPADSARLTERMRIEHREIERLLAEILRSIDGPAKLPDEKRAAFHELFDQHHRTEEGGLYPALDEMLAPEEGDDVVAQIQVFGSLTPR